MLFFLFVYQWKECYVFYAVMSHVSFTGEKPYRCKFENCERAFAQLSNLQHHMRNHDDQVKKEATRIHKCQICHRCYTNESSLKAHTLKVGSFCESDSLSLSLAI